jgi:hypothetical protein
VSPAVRAVGRFTEECDYEAAFALDLPESRTVSAEQWARSIFEGAPLAVRWFLIGGWTAITCRLRPRRSPSRVLGWQIENASPDVVVMTVQAWVGLTSHLVVSVDAGLVAVASFVRYSGPGAPVARTVWAATIPLHERMLPYLLTGAMRRPITPSGPDRRR